MTKYFKKKGNLFCCLFLFFLFTFNIYYFFIRRDVGPAFYIDKFFHRPIDKILELTIYQDLSEEYYLLNKNLKKKVIVFLGNSITKRFNLQEHFPDLLIINRGIFSDTTLGIINRLDRNINNLDIYKIFLMIGYNDLKYRTNDEIIDNISYIVSRIKVQYIYVQSILPVDAKRKDINLRIVNLNNRLKDLCKDRGYYYVDLHTHFLNKEGGIYLTYSRDGVHPNVNGYKLWAKIIRPIIK